MEDDNAPVFEQFGPYAARLAGIDPTLHLNPHLLGKLINSPEGEH